MREVNQREHFSNGNYDFLFVTDARFERQVHDIHIAAFYLDPVNRTIDLDDYNNQRILKFFQRCARSEEEANLMHTHFSLWREQLTPFEKGAFCWKFAGTGASFGYLLSIVQRLSAHFAIVCSQHRQTLFPANVPFPLKITFIPKRAIR